MQTTIFAILALPFLAFAAPAENAASKIPARNDAGTKNAAEFFKLKLNAGLTKRDDLCPYENCLDECIGWSVAAPCNPMDLCDPGLGCALGCAVACA